MQRSELLRQSLKESGPSVWGEPFHEAWMAGEGIDERVRFARAQAAEMAAAKPYVKPGELIIGNNARRGIVTGLPTAFRSGVHFDRDYLETARREHPDAKPKLDEIESYWDEWVAENGQYTPMAMHASLAYERVLAMGLDGLREHVQHWRAANTAARPECAPWYDALLATLDGISAFVGAHATAAEEAAARATDAQRQSELARIASACRQVAHGPPQSFHESAQLLYLLFWLCGHDSPGPIDRHLRQCSQVATQGRRGTSIGQCHTHEADGAAQGT